MRLLRSKSEVDVRLSLVNLLGDVRLQVAMLEVPPGEVLRHRAEEVLEPRAIGTFARDHDTQVAVGGRSDPSGELAVA